MEISDRTSAAIARLADGSLHGILVELRGDRLIVVDEVARGEDVRSAGALVFPGAFNPRHEGHCGMARTAVQRLGSPVVHEVSILNVDKPALATADISGRLAHFADEPVWLTRAPTFVEKSQLFPQATFVVELDTILRIADARYYGGDAAERDAALARLADFDSRFLVFGRLAGERFQTLADIDVPGLLRERCTCIGAEEFRFDVSSTELRAGQ